LARHVLALLLSTALLAAGANAAEAPAKSVGAIERTASGIFLATAGGTLAIEPQQGKALVFTGKATSVTLPQCLGAVQ
jgi:hypothetical protein